MSAVQAVQLTALTLLLQLLLRLLRSRLWCVALGRCLVVAGQQLLSVCELMAAAEHSSQQL